MKSLERTNRYRKFAIKTFFSLLFVICFLRCTQSDPNYVQFRLADNGGNKEIVLFPMISTGDSVRVEKTILLNLHDIAFVEARHRNTDSTALAIAVLTTEGAEKLSKITGANRGRDICAIVDTKVVFKVTIQVRIADGRIRLSRDVSFDEAHSIANKINLKIFSL